VDLGGAGGGNVGGLTGGRGLRTMREDGGRCRTIGEGLMGSLGRLFMKIEVMIPKNVHLSTIICA
jgi:hypothetical protein